MLTHILFAMLPETVILLLAFVCRTVSPLQMLPFLLLMAGLKTGYAVYHGFDHICTGRRFLIIPAASFLLELGGLTRVYAGLTSEIRLTTDAFLIIASVGVTMLLIKILRHEKIQKLIRYRPFLVWMGIMGISILGLLVYFLFAQKINGTKNWLYIGGISIQLSELLKLGVTAAFAFTVIRLRRSPYPIITFYIYMMITGFGLAVLIRELGTTMQLVFFTLSGGFLIASDYQKGQTPFLASKAFPLGCTWLICIGLGGIKAFLRKYCISHGLDERSTLGGINCRLNSITEETLLARQHIADAPVVRMNLSEYTPIISYSDSETIAADYCYATMCSCYGWMIPLAAVVFFILALGFVFFHLKKRIQTSASAAAGIAAAGILLFQVMIHVLGVFRLCPFTGITLPFASPGYSSLAVSVILTCVMIYAMTDNRKEV